MTAAAPRVPASRVLLGMFWAQCLLGLLVITADLPADLFRGPGPSAPPAEVPVTPGDQTRRFEPRQLPQAPPGNPGFRSDESIPPRLTFQPLPGDETVLLLTGEITQGDARRFAERLAALPEPPSAIALHSPGGLVQEALQIGRDIRAAGLPTRIAPGASCFSACPYILAGGTDRLVSRTGRVGVHQHYYGEDSFLPAFMAVSDVQAGQAEVMEYLVEMGIEPMLMAKALMTPPDDIYILLPEELDGFAMATELTD